MDINTRYKHGELSADVAKSKNDRLEINPNQKVKQGDLGSGSEKAAKKSKVDPSIFRMAEQKDY